MHPMFFIVIFILLGGLCFAFIRLVLSMSKWSNHTDIVKFKHFILLFLLGIALSALWYFLTLYLKSLFRLMVIYVGVQLDMFQKLLVNLANLTYREMLNDLIYSSFRGEKIEIGFKGNIENKVVNGKFINKTVFCMNQAGGSSEQAEDLVFKQMHLVILETVHPK